MQILISKGVGVFFFEREFGQGAPKQWSLSRRPIYKTSIPTSYGASGSINKLNRCPVSIDDYTPDGRYVSTAFQEAALLYFQQKVSSITITPLMRLRQ